MFISLTLMHPILFLGDLHARPREESICEWNILASNHCWSHVQLQFGIDTKTKTYRHVTSRRSKTSTVDNFYDVTVPKFKHDHVKDRESRKWIWTDQSADHQLPSVVPRCVSSNCILIICSVRKVSASVNDEIPFESLEAWHSKGAVDSNI